MGPLILISFFIEVGFFVGFMIISAPYFVRVFVFLPATLQIGVDTPAIISTVLAGVTSFTGHLFAYSLYTLVAHTDERLQKAAQADVSGTAEATARADISQDLLDLYAPSSRLPFGPDGVVIIKRFTNVALFFLALLNTTQEAFRGFGSGVVSNQFDSNLITVGQIVLPFAIGVPFALHVVVAFVRRRAARAPAGSALHRHLFRIIVAYTVASFVELASTVAAVVTIYVLAGRNGLSNDVKLVLTTMLADLAGGFALRSELACYLRQVPRRGHRSAQQEPDVALKEPLL